MKDDYFIYKTPFHALMGAGELASAEVLLPVFASSKMAMFPFQVSAARFVLGASYLKGAILCDEGALGKTYEAMLVIAQRYYEGCNRILIVVPLPLLRQWQEVMEECFSLPFTVQELGDDILLTTYEWVESHADELSQHYWDLTVFEEAHRLRKVNKESQAVALATDQCKFKLLLTATPMQNSIMDLYGLISFIDPNVLLPEKEFYQRYFRKPENYGELAETISKYCFRTTRNQVKNYVNIPKRLALTVEWQESDNKLYSLLDEYLQMQTSEAFPEMDRYDLALMLYRSLSSSKAAFVKLVSGAMARGDKKQLQNMIDHATNEVKVLKLEQFLQSCFTALKKHGAKDKVLIFTENRTTQNMLAEFLNDKKYTVVTYHGGADSALVEFKKSAQILIATDAAAEGFNLEFCSCVINYDLPYNVLTLEQRINRCHRQGQKADVLVVNFFNKSNFADVRTLELINKRLLQFKEIIGLSDDLLGDFDTEIDEYLEKMRSVEAIKNEFDDMLATYAVPNKDILDSAEKSLFCSFSRDIATEVKLTPQYIEEQSQELNNKLWALTKYFFKETREIFIDEATKTISCVGTPPKVFTGARMGRNEYSMDTNYRPRSGLHTLTGSLCRNILSEMFWNGVPPFGVVTVSAHIERCKIGLYKFNNQYVFVGKNSNGTILSDEDCRRLMSLDVVDYSINGICIGRSNRHLQVVVSDELDNLLNIPQDMANYLKQKLIQRKNELQKKVDDLKTELDNAQKSLENVTTRLEKIRLQKHITLATRNWKKAEESLFMDKARLDIEFEKRNRQNFKVERLFILEIRGI